MKTDSSVQPVAPPPVEKESILDWWHGWNRFWFQPAPATIPALMRIFAGILTLYVHLSYTTSLLSYIGPDAWGDRQVVKFLRNDVDFKVPPWDWEGRPIDMGKGYAAWSVWYQVEDPFWIYVLNTVFLLAMLSYTLGFCTRISGVLTYIATISFVNRLPFMTFGMDAMMVIVQTYLLIAPTGAMYSIDAWLARKRIGWWRNDAINPDQPPPTVASNFAIRLLQLHFCFVYGASGLSKLEGATWWNGEAVWRTIANPNFAPMQSPLFHGFLELLVHHRWLFHAFVGGSVLFTLFIEIGFPALVWNRRTRWVCVVGSVLLHTGIGFMMGLIGFSLWMLVFVGAFIPPETAVAFMHQLRSRWQALRRLAVRRPKVNSAPAGLPREELAALPR